VIKIDGSEGEGGGQVIRSSLALSMLTGKPHLTFDPGAVRGGDYHFAIGTAGSTTLVAQTVLPALLAAEVPSKVTVEGGTHNKMAPPFDFFQKAFLPLVERMGPVVNSQLIYHGFYPAGGGKIELEVQPAKAWRGIELLERKKGTPFVTTIISDLPATIGSRAASTICRKADWSMENSEVIEVPSPRGPGMIIMIRLDCGSTVEVFSSVGEVGIKTEQVARKVLRDARRFLKLDVPVGPHLADQLMLPMAIAADREGQGSRFRTGALTQHSLTHIDIIRRFLDVDISVTENTDQSVEVSIGK